MVSFIPDCMNDIFSSKNNWCFEHPALFATLFLEGSRGKMKIKSKRNGKQDPVEDCCWIWFLILRCPSHPSKKKSNKREWSVLEKWGKDLSWRQIFTARVRAKAYHTSLAYAQDQKCFAAPNFRLFYSCSSLKKQSKKTREHFSSNKSGFIGKHKSKDRQRPNWKENSTVRLHST